MAYVDELNRLANKLLPANRYRNFGTTVQHIEVYGFRGLVHLGLPVSSPITALSGLNGSGKSTVSQLAACAFKKPSTAARPRYYVKDFFPVSVADPVPFTQDASVVVEYGVEKTAEAQSVTVTRASKEWGGYKRQPEKACYYVGFTQFLPKIERRDFSIYASKFATLGDSAALGETERECISRILGISYDSMDFTDVRHRDRHAELATATRSGARYSENHMGFGEGRVVHTVPLMERSPAQSLFVLEEPETALHGDAQEKLAEYFVDVSNRRGHQIFLTTHSASILLRLPGHSNIYLRRHPSTGVVEPIPGLAAYQVDAYLRNATPGARAICVEDERASIFLTSMLRRADPHLLAGCRIVLTKGESAMKGALKVLKGANVRVAGVRDGDMTATAESSILPGGAPPEEIVFRDPAVAADFSENFDIDIADILAAA